MTLLMTVVPLGAQCQMQYNVSVYADGSVSDDLSTVYGYSNFVDSSIRCGATHSSYSSITTIYPPSDSSAQHQTSGTESNVQIATNGVQETYEVEGDASLYCSAARSQIESGGPRHTQS